MNGMLGLVERELRSAVRSPVAFAVLGVYLALHGLFFAQLMEEYSTRSFQMIANGVLESQQNLSDMVVRPLLMGDAFLLLLLLPALSMRSLADEWRQGTIDLLLSYPLRESDIVLGKYLASLVVLAGMILVSAAYPISTAFFGQLEVPILLTGLLGLFLYGATILAVGLLFSALTENQVIAFVSTVVTLLGVTFLSWWGARTDSLWGQVLTHLSLLGHVDAPSSGLVRLSDLVFFGGLITFFLYLCTGVLEAKRWRRGGTR